MAATEVMSRVPRRYFAAINDRIGSVREGPCNVWCGDQEAREVVEQLNRDASYEPVYAGGLENAAVQESFCGLCSRSTKSALARSSSGWRSPSASEVGGHSGPASVSTRKQGRLPLRAPLRSERGD